MTNNMQFDISASELAKKLAREQQMPFFALKRLILTAPHRYKHYEIPKRSDPNKKRKIAHPAKELKLVQRWLVKNLLNNLKVHEAAAAYEKDSSIRKNADQHAQNQYLLKMDFKDFFPSIIPSDLLQFTNDLNPHDFYLLQQFLFCKNKKTGELVLSIGAPSSPKVSNIVMFDFDTEIKIYCDNKGIIYTRYADDLTFSTNEPNLLKHCEEYVIKTSEKSQSPRLLINQRKTVHTSKKRQRRVTGLVLSNQGEVSLGRERKRTMRACLHNYSMGAIDNPEELNKLRGWLAFAQDSEPKFIERLKAKYSDDIIALLNMEFKQK